LSGPGRTPRHPKGKGEVTNNLASARLDSLANNALADKIVGHADLLAADYHDLLVVE
jgi:hypothetical protein